MREVSSLYIHYPYCKHLCHYCDFYKHLYSKGSEKDFEKYLEKNLELNAQFMKSHGFELTDLVTLYLGGGTPSLMGESLSGYVNKIFKYYGIKFRENYECTLEIDPGTYESFDVVDSWVNFGVNRFSVGIQSLDSFIHKHLDRLSHNLDTAYTLLEYFQKKEVNFSVDFIIGVMDDKFHKRDIEKELEEILTFKPKHISLYILSVSKNYRHFEILPQDEQVESEYKRVHEFLSSKGFGHYEVSNYALDGHESKHNWNYWKQASYAALGPSATGLLVGKDFGKRYKWSASGKCEVEELNQDQLKLEKLYTLARTKNGVPINLLDPFKYRGLVRNGDAEIVNENLVFNPSRWNILDSLFDQLL